MIFQEVDDPHTMPSTLTRRSIFRTVGICLTGGVAGCLSDDEPISNCSAHGIGGEDDGPLINVGALDGDEQVSLGIAVSQDAPRDDRFATVVVRDRDGELVADIPLRSNRRMSDLDTDVDPKFGGSNGELYAVPLGPPPQHGKFTVSIVDESGAALSTMEYRFNCYAANGDLP